MESRAVQNNLRVGPSGDAAGESHTPASAGGRPVYTEGAKHAIAEETAASGSMSREGTGPAHLTASGREPLTDEDVDFSVPQPNGQERMLKLLQKKKLRGDVDLPRVLLTRDVIMPSTSSTRRDKPGYDFPDYDIPGRYDTGADTDDLSDCSDMSFTSMGSFGTYFDKPRKRKTEDEDFPALSKGAATKPKRGRGRPPTTGQYVGLAKAQAELNRAKEEAIRLKAEEELAAEMRRAREARASTDATPATLAEEDRSEQTNHALARRVETSLEAITKVATKSSNLKGTFQKCLKDAVADIRAAVTEMRSRSTNEDVARLEAQNARLQERVASLGRELEELRRRADNSRPQEKDIRELLSEVSRANIETFGNMLNARLAGLEDRLLPEPRRRPPLRTDAPSDPAPADSAGCGVAPEPASTAPTKKSRKKSAPKPTYAEAAAPSTANVVAAPAEAPTAPAANSKKKRKRLSMAAKEATKGGAPSNPSQTQETWTEVGTRKGGKKKKKGAANPEKAAPKKKKKVKLRVPSTAAVTLKLGEKAAEKGVTYAGLIKEARTKVDLGTLGIPNLGFRIAETGARVLTVDGEDAKKKADALAAKLREVLQDGNKDVVTVGRPVKCADLRLTGLDESVSALQVKLTVARIEGGCPISSMRVGKIVTGPRGDGSLWMSVPVEVAKKLAKDGKLQVGWCLAKVTLLAARPKRCYRCQNIGHVAAKCECPVDRSRSCFRCGSPGHKMAECGEPPNCFLCSVVGNEATHVVGSSKCPYAQKRPTAKDKRGVPSRARQKKPAPGAAAVPPTPAEMEVEA